MAEEKENPTTFNLFGITNEDLVAVSETVTSMATGMAASAAGGAAAMGRLFGGVSLDEAEKTITAVQEVGTKTPTTPRGKQLAQFVGEKLSFLGEPAKFLGESAAEATGAMGGGSTAQAIAGTGTEIFGDPLNLIGLKGVGLAGTFGVARKMLGKARSASIAEAKALEVAGATPEQIFKETGHWRGPLDNEWRAVVEPKGKIRRVHVFEDGEAIRAPDKGVALSEIYDDPDLFEAFPFLEEYTVRNLKNPAKQAEVDTRNKIIGVTAAKAADFKSGLLHEIQHIVQETHGIPGGGSPSEFYPRHLTNLEVKIHDIAQEIRKLERSVDDRGIRRQADKEVDPDYLEAQSLRGTHSHLMSVQLKAVEQYATLAGEAEARAVQKYFEKWRAGERGIFPIELYDRPLSSLHTDNDMAMTLKRKADSVGPPRVRLPDGEVGTLVSTTRVPKRNVEGFKQELQRLHDQAFQGHLAGQLTFEQATAIYDDLLKKNKERLDNIYKQDIGEYADSYIVERADGRKKRYSIDEVTFFDGPKEVK